MGLAKLRSKLQKGQMDNNLRKFQHSVSGSVFGHRPNIFLDLAFGFWPNVKK